MPGARFCRKEADEQGESRRRREKSRRGGLTEAQRLDFLAERLDRRALALSRGRPAVDLALGLVLLKLEEDDLLIELHRSKFADFAREDLGLEPRTCRAVMDLARGLREYPLLRRAVLAGAVSTVKAELVLRVITPEIEEPLTACALSLSVRELKSLVQGPGDGEDEDAWRFHLLRFSMTAEDQDRIDFALFLARKVVGADAPRFRLEEFVARDYLEAVGGEVPASEQEKTAETEADEPAEPAPLSPALARCLAEMEAQGDTVRKQLAVVSEAFHFVSSVEKQIPTLNAMGLLALARRLIARRERFDEPLGRVLRLIRIHRLFKFLGAESFEEYCRERLGIAGSTARERIALERRMRRLPLLRQALLSGRLGYSKAKLIARIATPEDVAEWIAFAAGTTCQKLRQRIQEMEDREDRERGERKIRGPREAIETVTAAIRRMEEEMAASGLAPDPGTAWGRVGAGFIARWEVPLGRAEWRPKWQQEVLVRTGGLCAAPGCTRAARHVHHIRFREQGGPDLPWNGVGLCAACHRLGIHGGRILLRGRGGEFLVWEYRDGDGKTVAVWETHGADDVRRGEIRRPQARGA